MKSKKNLKKQTKKQTKNSCIISPHPFSERKRKKCTHSISHLFTHKTLDNKQKKFPPSSNPRDIFSRSWTKQDIFLFIGKHSYLKKKKKKKKHIHKKYFSFCLYFIIFIIFIYFFTICCFFFKFSFYFL